MILRRHKGFDPRPPTTSSKPRKSKAVNKIIKMMLRATSRSPAATRPIGLAPWQPRMIWMRTPPLSFLRAGVLSPQHSAGASETHRYYTTSTAARRADPECQRDTTTAGHAAEPTACLREMTRKVYCPEDIYGVSGLSRAWHRTTRAARPRLIGYAYILRQKPACPVPAGQGAAWTPNPFGWSVAL